MSGEHGKSSTYTHGGCRCEACREAHTAENREVTRRMRERLAAGLEIIHGVNRAYTVWGCRCDACREAHRLAAARVRELAP